MNKKNFIFQTKHLFFDGAISQDHDNLIYQFNGKIELLNKKKYTCILLL